MAVEAVVALAVEDVVSDGAGVCDPGNNPGGYRCKRNSKKVRRFYKIFLITEELPQ